MARIWLSLGSLGQVIRLEHVEKGYFGVGLGIQILGCPSFFSFIVKSRVVVVPS